MKLNQITLAVVALATAPVALALTPAQIDGTTARLWLSGASAPTASVYKGVLTLCKGMKYKDALGNIHTNAGVLDTHLYLESSSAGKLPGGAGDRMAYTCTAAVDGANEFRIPDDLEGKKMVVFHTVEGGSFNYVAPHITIAGEANTNLTGNLKRTSNIEGLAAGGQCAAAPAQMVNVDISGQTNAVGVYRGCATTTVNFTANQPLRANVFQAPDRPEGGLSDTEYTINKLNLGITTEVSEIGQEAETFIGQAFGVAVSYPLYHQLQKKDFGSAHTCVTGGSATLPDLTAACQPNMAASTYTAIADANSIGVASGTLFGAAITPPGTSGKIQLERRAITSGTQSASNLYFLNTPCALGTAGGALVPARTVDNTSKVDVAENSSTGGVKTGLTNASNAGEFGLGVVSLENIPGSGEKWAFVKLDAVSPNFTAAGAVDAKQRVNAIANNYKMWYEITAFTATTAFPEGIALIEGVKTALGNPEITDLPGLFISSGAGAIGSNVSKVTRGANSCSPAR
jgi:hypothetical protein